MNGAANRSPEHRQPAISPVGFEFLSIGVANLLIESPLFGMVLHLSALFLHLSVVLRRFPAIGKQFSKGLIWKFSNKLFDKGLFLCLFWHAFFNLGFYVTLDFLQVQLRSNASQESYIPHYFLFSLSMAILIFKYSHCLQGRAMSNAIGNLELVGAYVDALKSLGRHLEEVDSQGG